MYDGGFFSCLLVNEARQMCGSCTWLWDPEILYLRILASSFATSSAAVGVCISQTQFLVRQSSLFVCIFISWNIEASLIPYAF